jgi:hypothetical protein
VASAGAAAANPTNTCEGKTWLAELVCKAQHDAKVDAKREHEEQTWSLFRMLQRPLSPFDWFLPRAQDGKSTMISSSVRPSTSPAATAPSEAVKRKDGTEAGTRSP